MCACTPLPLALLQSFHFSPRLPGKDWKASEAAHEARIAAVLGLKPGMKALDCGCGVGGPLRTIASVSGAHITGLTINEYQVGRARYHNHKVRRGGAGPGAYPGVRTHPAKAVQRVHTRTSRRTEPQRPLKQRAADMYCMCHQPNTKST